MYSGYSPLQEIIKEKMDRHFYGLGLFATDIEIDCKNLLTKHIRRRMMKSSEEQGEGI